jgi:gliding motility-associated-like protein
LRLLLTLYYLLLLTQIIYGQAVTASDCPQAVNICSNASFSIDANGSGIEELDNAPISNPSTNPVSSNSGCLLTGETNSTWMIINVASSGTLEFSFGNANGGTGYYDWIMWPYSANACSQIASNQLAPIRCNWNSSSDGFTGIASPVPAGGVAGNFEPELQVTAGQQFVLCLSNFSNSITTLPLNFFGTANASCNTVVPITVNSMTICPGESVTLTASYTSGNLTTFTWSPGGQTGQSITVSPTSTTTYSVTASGTTPNGGLATGVGSGTVSVLSANNPSCSCTITASNSGPVCVGNTYNLTATNLTGGSYNWTLDGVSIGSTQNVSNLPTTAPGSYTINLTGTDGVGHVCNSSTTLIVYPLPNVNAGQDVNVCNNTPVTLAASGANTYTWTNNVQNGVSFIPSLSGVYSVTGTDANGCQNTDNLLLTFLNANPPIVVPDATIGCRPFTVLFQNNSGQTQNCVWDFGNGTTATNCSNQSAIYNQTGCYDVTVTHTDSQGCDTTVTFQSIVCVEESVAEFTTSPGVIGPGNNTVMFLNSSQGAQNYLWNFGDGNTSTEFEPSNEFDVSTQSGYEVSLITYSDAGCSDTAFAPISYEEQLIFYVPNSFTPDSDEHNQTFCPIFTSGFDPFNFEMKIYNRWGELIFVTLDHTKGWDGSYGSKGIHVQAGVYTWVINFKPKSNDEKIVVNGFVNVLE